MRIKRANLKQFLGEETCALCPQGKLWNGKSLTLPIDHIDGDRDNNDPSNLRYLCPNCHSQTETFAGRNSRKPPRELVCEFCTQPFLTKSKVKTRKFCNIKCANQKTRNRHPDKIQWPNLEDLQEMVTLNGYSGTGRILGVSDVAVRKHLLK